MKTYQTTFPELTIKKNKSDFAQVKIKLSSDAANVMRQFYFDDIEIFESFFILLLNRANNTIGYVKISQGGCISTVVDVKLIAKYALDSLAQGVILCHNHPSGNLQPSDGDKSMTDRIKQVLDLFQCNVLDHIILTKEGYYSFADEGLL